MNYYKFYYDNWYNYKKLIILKNLSIYLKHNIETDYFAKLPFLIQSCFIVEKNSDQEINAKC